MSDELVLAYLAGAMDSDGYFSIRKSTYHMRVRKDAYHPVYSERIGLKQVTPDIPHLLHAIFGAQIRQDKGGSENSKPLWGWQATDLNAAKACHLMLPYLRVKKAQATLLLELRGTKTKGVPSRKTAYWFVQEFPDWQDMEMITTSEVCAILGYKDRGSVSQALANGTLIALPWNHAGRELPRFPKLLLERLVVTLSKDGRARIQDEHFVAIRESLYQKVRELNKIGINGTPIYYRTGPYTPL